MRGKRSTTVLDLQSIDLSKEVNVTLCYKPLPDFKNEDRDALL